MVSVWVFAAVAQRTTAEELGALALGTTFSSVSIALAPAVIGKPLAAMLSDSDRRQAGVQAFSAALGLACVGSLVLLLVAAVTDGLTKLAALGGAVGVLAGMVVEGYYWKRVFAAGRRSAGLELSGAYAAQAVAVTACVLVGPLPVVILSPFLGLAGAALVMLSVHGGVNWGSARVWCTQRSGLWLPFVLGVSASVVLVQTIPVVLAAKVGFKAASVYRAGELAFGVTNLLIGVSIQSLLTQATARPFWVYTRFSIALALVAVANGLALALIPVSLLEAVIGPTGPLLVGVLPIITVQRVALAVSSLGSILLVPLLSPRRLGTLEVVAAGLALLALLVGAEAGGLRGALLGLASVEVTLSIMFAVLLRRSV